MGKDLLQGVYRYQLPVSLYRQIQQRTCSKYRHHDNTSLIAEKQMLLLRLIAIELEQERRTQEYRHILRKAGLPCK